MNIRLCSTCGYIVGNEHTKICPVCNSKIKEFEEINKDNNSLSNYKDKNLNREANEDIRFELNQIFNKECLEVGIYLAMSIIANEEGYDKVCDKFKQIAYEEANHASILAILLREDIQLHTKDNLIKMIKEEYNSTQKKLKIVKKTKELGLDTTYNLLNIMCKDEIKHSKEFALLLNKYFSE